MTETSEIFNVAVAGLRDDLFSTDGKKTGKAGANENLEFLLMLEMFRDRPEVQKMIDALEKRGGKLARNKFASTSFMKAVLYSRLDKYKSDDAGKNRPKNADWSNMMNAAYHNRIEALLKQIKKGMRLDQKNEAGQTAYSLAKARGNSQILALLDIAQNYLILLEKNKYHESKDPTRSHFLSKEYQQKKQA